MKHLEKEIIIILVFGKIDSEFIAIQKHQQNGQSFFFFFFLH